MRRAVGLPEIVCRLIAIGFCGWMTLTQCAGVGRAQDKIDETPLKIEAVPAFTEVTWTGWVPEVNGLAIPFRPILITHLGDGSNRLCVPSQQGAVHLISNKPGPQASRVLLDISAKVVYADKQNEEGLLGLAFHPKFKENGEFYVYYTSKDAGPSTSVISRFRTTKANPEQADPASEEELLRIPQPFWNHNGGTLCFGPDGFLYVGLGDGGYKNDPYGHGQNLTTLHGSILRLNVDQRDPGLKYAVPKDNPFVGKKDGSCPEIYATGFRNIWRMSFDRANGDFWVADVGQDLWEEINLVKKGGNYGWNLREGQHKFGEKGADPRPELIDPIFEYDHTVGKSITGGHVYRGKKLPELVGMYVYADYVSGKIWALKYDAAQKKVTANRLIASPKMPVLSFGEDEAGELYFSIVAGNGQGLYTFK